MINILFGKFLLTCDYPHCTHNLRLKNADDADRAIKDNRWLALEVQDKILFLCNKCTVKVVGMSKEKIEQMINSAAPMK